MPHTAFLQIRAGFEDPPAPLLHTGVLLPTVPQPPAVLSAEVLPAVPADAWIRCDPSNPFRTPAGLIQPFTPVPALVTIPGAVVSYRMAHLETGLPYLAPNDLTIDLQKVLAALHRK